MKDRLFGTLVSSRFVEKSSNFVKYQKDRWKMSETNKETVRNRRIAAALIGASLGSVLYGCRGKSVIVKADQANSGSNNEGGSKQVDESLGLNTYTAELAGNTLDPFLEQKMKSVQGDRTDLTYTGFCIKYHGVAGATGEADDCFGITEDKFGNREMFQRTWDGKELGVKQVSTGISEDGQSIEVFDQDGKVIISTPKDLDAQLQKTGVATAYISPGDGVRGAMPLLGEDELLAFTVATSQNALLDINNAVISNVSNTGTDQGSDSTQPETQDSQGSQEETPAVSEVLLGMEKEMGDKYTFEYNKESSSFNLVNKETGEAVEEITFNEDGSWRRIYVFSDSGTKMGNLGLVLDGNKEDVNIVEDGKGRMVLEFTAWNFIEGKGWERKTFEGQPLFNPLESQMTVINDGDPNNTSYDLRDFDDYSVGGSGHQVLRYRNISEGVDPNFWWEKFIPVKNADGSYRLVDCTVYEVDSFINKPYSYVAYRDKDDVLRIVLVDGANLNSLDNLGIWNPYYIDHPVEKSSS